MSEISYIKCECDFDANAWNIETSGTLMEIGFVTTCIANAVRKAHLEAGYSDEQAKHIVVGGIEKFWGIPEFQGRSNEDENISK